MLRYPVTLAQLPIPTYRSCARRASIIHTAIFVRTRRRNKSEIPHSRVKKSLPLSIHKTHTREQTSRTMRARNRESLLEHIKRAPRVVDRTYTYMCKERERESSHCAYLSASWVYVRIPTSLCAREEGRQRAGGRLPRTAGHYRSPGHILISQYKPP